MRRDNGFNKVCPSGNHMIDGFKERKIKDPNDYPSWKEDEDMERYYEKKYGKDSQCP